MTKNDTLSILFLGINNEKLYKGIYLFIFWVEEGIAYK